MLKTRVLSAVKSSVVLLTLAALVASPASAANIISNPNFNQGADNLEGYEAYAFFSQGATAFDSAWGLADAPVTADGSGTAVFSMNTQLANDDSFWVGATQEMNFQQNFWTPDNNAGVTTTVDLYGNKLVFTGIAQVTQAYAAGNQGQVFIQFLDQSYNSVAFVPADVSTLGPSGGFILEADAPASGLNIIQIGFRNSGIEGTAGQMTISNLSLTAVPEPSTVGMGLMAAGVLTATMVRRRRKMGGQLSRES